jgi:hypothetical protein
MKKLTENVIADLCTAMREKARIPDLLGEQLRPLKGASLPVTVINQETGEAIVPAGRRLTFTLLRKIAWISKHISFDPDLPFPERQQLLDTISAFNRRVEELQAANILLVQGNPRPRWFQTAADPCRIGKALRPGDVFKFAGTTQYRLCISRGNGGSCWETFGELAPFDVETIFRVPKLDNHPTAIIPCQKRYASAPAEDEAGCWWPNNPPIAVIEEEARKLTEEQIHREGIAQRRLRKP